MNKISREPKLKPEFDKDGNMIISNYEEGLDDPKDLMSDTEFEKWRDEEWAKMNDPKE